MSVYDEIEQYLPAKLAWIKNFTSCVNEYVESLVESKVSKIVKKTIGEYTFNLEYGYLCDLQVFDSLPNKDGSRKDSFLSVVFLVKQIVEKNVLACHGAEMKHLMVTKKEWLGKYHSREIEIWVGFFEDHVTIITWRTPFSFEKAEMTATFDRVPYETRKGDSNLNKFVFRLYDSSKEKKWVERKFDSNENRMPDHIDSTKRMFAKESNDKVFSVSHLIKLFENRGNLPQSENVTSMCKICGKGIKNDGW